MAATGQARTGQEILDAVLQKQLALSPEDHAAKSARICATLFAELAGREMVMIYVSRHPEVSTLGLIQLLYRQNRRVVVSRVDPGIPGCLDLSFLPNPAAPVTGTFQMIQSGEGEFPGGIFAIDTAVVPLPAFDRSGNMLGDRSGHYARFLATIPRAKKIGLAFACQEVDTVPGGPENERMDCIITENGVIRQKDLSQPPG